MIRYVSTFSTGSHHDMINRALLEMLQSGNENEICVYASASTPIFTNAETSRRIFLPSGHGRLSLLMRYLLGALNNLAILLSSRRNDIVFYNFNNLFSLSWIDRLSRWMKRDVVIVCHNEMEYLVDNNRHTRIDKKLLRHLARSYFLRSAPPAPRLRFIVLGDIIKTNLSRLLSAEMMSKFSAIDHPIIIDDETVSRFQPTDTKHPVTRIGTVGIMNSYKGMDRYPAIVSAINNKNVVFSTVGMIQGNPTPLVEAGIEIPSQWNRPMDKTDFSRCVSNLDFILLLYGRDTYSLIASGAVLDAIRYHKPIIALRTDYFEYLFKKFGPFGYLVDNDQELIALLDRADTLSRNFDFEAIASRLAPQNLKL